MGRRKGSRNRRPSPRLDENPEAGGLVEEGAAIIVEIAIVMGAMEPWPHAGRPLAKLLVLRHAVEALRVLQAKTKAGEG